MVIGLDARARAEAAAGGGRAATAAAVARSPAGPRGDGSGLLAQAWRQRAVFAAVFLAVGALSAALVFVLPVRYSASGSIIVGEQEPLAGTSPSAAALQKLGDPADLESHLLLIRSPRILRAALARPGVADALRRDCEAASGQAGLGAVLRLVAPGEGCAKLQHESSAAVEWVQDRYGVGSVGRSRVIAVSYSSPRADVAQAMANALIQAYLDDQATQKAESRQTAAAYLWQEIAQVGEQLRSDEAAIQAYRRSHGLIRGQTAPITSERLSALSQQLAAAQAAQAEAAARVQESAGRGSGDARAVLDSRAVADLKQQLGLVSAQVASLAQQVGPNHPALAQAHRQQAELQGRIDREAQSYASSAQRSYAAAAAQVAALSRQLEATKQDVGTATDSEAAIASMVREAEVKRELYTDLYKRASQMETERRVLTPSTHLVNLAELPLRPAFPKKAPFLAAGLTLAAILATAAALLRDRAGRGVPAAAARAELHAVTGLPVLAQVPLAGTGAGIACRSGLAGGLAGALNGLQHQGGLRARLGAAAAAAAVAAPDASFPVQQDLPDTLAEAGSSSLVQDGLRGLYAQLVLAGYGGRRRTLLVTSAGPQEGKTATVLALAQFASRSPGRRVLAIECDLRRPCFAQALGLPGSSGGSGQPGLADLLGGRVGIEDVVVNIGGSGLDILPAGKPCVGSTEMLIDGRFAELLHWAARGYDLVLLDSPPSAALMDARVIARQVDGVLLCARWGAAPVDEVAAAVDALRDAGGRPVGMVVTMAQPADAALYDPAAAHTVGGAAAFPRPSYAPEPAA